MEEVAAASVPCADGVTEAGRLRHGRQIPEFKTTQVCIVFQVCQNFIERLRLIKKSKTLEEVFSPFLQLLGGGGGLTTFCGGRKRMSQRAWVWPK